MEKKSTECLVKNLSDEKNLKSKKRKNSIDFFIDIRDNNNTL